MGTSVCAFPCSCCCDIIRTCEWVDVPLSGCKEIHFPANNNGFQGNWINVAQYWLNLAQMAPFRIQKNTVPLPTNSARMLTLGHSSKLDGSRLTASMHPKSATSMARRYHLAVGSQLIRPKADYVCSQEHSKVSFQLLGIFLVTRKAPRAATLGIFLRSRDAVVWNLRLTDVKDKRKKHINNK